MTLARVFWAAGAIASCALAQSSFPLQSGNSWMYRLQGSPGDVRSISVEAKETLNGNDYFNVRYFGQLLLLRADSADAIFAYDRQAGTERPWLSPGMVQGATFATTIDPCVSTGRIVSQAAAVSTPAGQFANAVQIAFTGPCADAGTTQQFYVAGVGLVAHEETSFAGPRRYELVYSSLSPRAAEMSFTTALDAARYAPDSDLTARLTLRNTTPDTVNLVFPSGQDYDLEIVNDRGDVVYQWARGKAFTMIYREEKFGPGERNWSVTAPLAGLAPGHYRARAHLATSPLLYTAEVGFDIAGPLPAVPNAGRRRQ